MGLNDNNSLKAMNSQQKSNYINMVANIVKDNVKVASFKIFDTLVLSGFWENSDLFHLMENEFKDLYVGKKTFYELRKTAEEKALKKSKTGKPEFDEIYRQLEKIGLDGQHYSVHKLRHTAATLMYQHGGVDTLVIKEVLGHENLATTEIYTHLENKQLRDAAKSNPLSGESPKSEK